MLAWGWVRVLAASLLLAGWGFAEGIGSLLGSRRARSGRRPRWSHFLGFASLAVFYALIARQGGALWEGFGNQVGWITCGLAMALRLGARLLPLRHPGVVLRIVFFAALPLAVGAPRAWFALSVPQAIIAIDEMRRADAMDARVGGPISAGSR